MAQGEYAATAQYSPRNFACTYWIQKYGSLVIKNKGGMPDMNSKQMCPEDTIKILAENTTRGVVVIQDDHIIFANRALAHFHGCDSPSDIIGRNVFSLGHRNKKIFERTHRENLLGLNCGKLNRWQGIGIGGRAFDIQSRPNSIIWHHRPAILTISTDSNIPAVDNVFSLEDLQVTKSIPKWLSSERQLSRGFATDMVGKSEVMEKLHDKIRKASHTDFHVLIQGESGSGKELVAKAIHNNSPRYKNSFIAVNSSAINEHVFESEYFGHKRGAFTGAISDRRGFFDAADGGTLFLDEIGDLSRESQTKLLRVFDSGEFYPVGSTAAKKCDTRVIMATNCDLAKLVETGRMREDFFFRINQIVIEVPPLRDRLEDIPLLATHFIEHFYKKRNIDEIPGHIIEKLSNYHWPGNVRELQNTLAKYITFGKIDLLEKNTSPKDALFNLKQPSGKDSGAVRGKRLHSAVKALEIKMITEALTEFHGNKCKAADHLGTPKRTFFRKVSKYGLS